jgi:pilus assembly protein Flp/PilA
MRKFIKTFARDDRGVSALEYAILAGIVVVALVASLTAFNTQVTALWTRLTAQVQAAGA